MINEAMLFGPYIGSFCEEVLMFRPYVNWVTKCLSPEHIVVSSHFNRKFLYDNICDKFIPVYKQLSRRELLQIGYIHDDVKQKDYVVMTKNLKDKVADGLKITKKNVEVMSLPYIRCSPPISIYNRIFTPIKVPVISGKCNVLFIPDISMSPELSTIILNHLRSTTNVSVIGDMNCHLPEENELINDIEYLNNGHLKMVTAITNSRAVITPCSHWTALANMQKTPVLSWGDTVGPYKEGGIYYMGNKGCRTVYHDSDSSVINLLKQIDSFLENVI